MKKFAAVLLIGAMLLCLGGCKASDYKSAVAAMDAGDYVQALPVLEALGDYKDAADLTLKCRYALAEADFDQGNYETARSAFEALGSYRDSAGYITRCDYNLAVKAYEAKKYEEALAMFRNLNGFSDSDRYILLSENALLKGNILGQWVSQTIDVTPVFLSILEYQDPLLSEAAQEAGASLGMVLTITFSEDELCTVQVNLSDLEGFSQRFGDLFRSYLTKVLDRALQEEGMSIEDLYAELGTRDIDEIYQALYEENLQDAIDAFGMQEYLEEAFSQLETRNSFTVQDGEISCSGDTFRYDSATDTLTLDAEEIQEMIGQTQVEFQRGETAAPV